MTEQDRIKNEERRRQILGRMEGYLLLLVAYAVSDGTEVIRIISARRPNRKRGNIMSKAIHYEVDLEQPAAPDQ